VNPFHLLKHFEPYTSSLFHVTDSGQPVGAWQMMHGIDSVSRKKGRGNSCKFPNKIPHVVDKGFH